MLHFFLILLCLSFITSPQYANSADDLPKPVTAQVTKVVDGDTLEILTINGKETMRLRLYGMDAPETYQAYGCAAENIAKDLILKAVTIVTVRLYDKDRYGRYTADIFLPDGTRMSHEMIRQGYAWWYRAYAPDEVSLYQAEQAARKAKRGLWKDSEPVAPWDCRKLHREGKPC